MFLLQAQIRPPTQSDDPHVLHVPYDYLSHGHHDRFFCHDHRDRHAHYDHVPQKAHPLGNQATLCHLRLKVYSLTHLKQD